MKMRNCFCLMLGVLIGAGAAAQNTPEDSTAKAEKVVLGNIELTEAPFVKRLDSLMKLNLFTIGDTNVEATEQFQVNVDSIKSRVPDFHDTIYEDRLQKLDARTPLNLAYNSTVRAYIEVYSKKKREQLRRMLGLANYYFPMFEEKLDQYNIPLELKYLAVVESALNPHARSRVGATGLWQFMYSTGKMNGLEISSYIDERSDPLKSTEAACQYLKKLYTIFDDWNLALAAYNSGPGNVSKAIRRSGGQQNYWAIRPFLPRETASYVPAFIAVNYIMNYAPEHNLYPKDVKPTYFAVDTVKVKEKISFEQIQKLIGISKEKLSFLNPGYRYDVIPEIEEDYCTLVLPSSKMGLFISNEDSIYKLARADFEQNKASQPEYVEMNDRIHHRVRRGEVLGTIAEKYGVGVSSIRRWNGIRGNTIRIGQRLTIYPNKIPSSYGRQKSSSSSKKISRSEDGKYLKYHVSRGESFYSIARKYPGISADNIMKWNNYSHARSLKPGVKLKIYTES